MQQGLTTRDRDMGRHRGAAEGAQPPQQAGELIHDGGDLRPGRLVGAGALLWWWERETNGRDLVLYGNVDLRQVDLAFNNSQRIKEIAVQEGDKVQQGQCIARLDTDRLEPQVARAEAELAADASRAATPQW